MLEPAVASIARMIDHALLHPTMGEAEMRQGCETALKWEVASVCIKPYAVPLAATILRGSNVQTSTVVGFPHGGNVTSVKYDEARIALSQGASEIDMVCNIGKVVDGDWAYVRSELKLINELCKGEGGLLKVIFETDFLPDDEVKIALCKICSEVGVAYVKTSTGFGFTKNESGFYSYKGATEHDVKLMRNHTAQEVGVKASGNIKTLGQLLRFRDLGATRIGTSSTDEILRSISDSN